MGDNERVVPIRPGVQIEQPILEIGPLAAEKLAKLSRISYAYSFAHGVTAEIAEELHGSNLQMYDPAALNDPESFDAQLADLQIERYMPFVTAVEAFRLQTAETGQPTSPEDLAKLREQLPEPIENPDNIDIFSPDPEDRAIFREEMQSMRDTANRGKIHMHMAGLETRFRMAAFALQHGEYSNEKRNMIELEYAEAKDDFERLKEQNPDYQSPFPS